MAEDNGYHIYIHLDELNGSSQAMAGTGAENSTENTSNGLSSAERAVGKALGGIVSFAAVKSTAERLISYKISQVNLRTGAAEYEERLALTHSIISQTVGAGAALVSAGIAGGPVGAFVAGVGIAVSGVNKLFDMWQRQQTLQAQQSLENIAIGFADVRAGTAGRRSKDQ